MLGAYPLNLHDYRLHEYIRTTSATARYVIRQPLLFLYHLVSAGHLYLVLCCLLQVEACHPMIGGYLFKGRLLLAALFRRDRTAWVKMTSRRRVQWAGDFTLQQHTGSCQPLDRGSVLRKSMPWYTCALDSQRGLPWEPSQQFFPGTLRQHDRRCVQPLTGCAQ